MCCKRLWKSENILKIFDGVMADTNFDRLSFRDITEQLKHDRDQNFGILYDQSDLSVSSLFWIFGEIRFVSVNGSWTNVDFKCMWQNNWTLLQSYRH